MEFAGEDLVVDVELVPLGSALATLSGDVTNIETGQPITDQLVQVELVGFASTMTDETGHYLITDIPPGTYAMIRFTHPQYETLEITEA